MSTRQSACILVAAIAAACGGLPALAQPPGVPAQGPMTFTTFDQDGNGIVTEQEFDSARAQRMAARAGAGAPMRGAANAPSFADFDQNGDGKLTAAEFTTVQQARMQARPGMGMGPGAGMGPGSGGGPGLEPSMGPGMGRGMGRNMPRFTEFDLNSDGVLTEQEFYQARAKRIAQRSQQGYPMRNLPSAPAFSDLDLDASGRVDPREFATAQAQHRQQMMAPPAAPEK